MNQVLQCLKTRRSVRSYSETQISDEDLNAILEAGIYAPSGNGKQSGKIVVLQNPSDIAELEKLNARVLGNDSHPFYGAPTVCLVLADADVYTCVEDGSLIIGNMLIAAHSLGLAACWIHRARQVFDSPEGKALLNKWGISGNYIGVGHCILGYAQGKPGAPKARKSDYILRV